MDDKTKMPDSVTTESNANETPARPTVDKQDCSVATAFTTHAAFNDFLMRLEHLRQKHKDWQDTRNQGRPFKQPFISFIQRLVLRLPVAPEITPLSNGTVRFRYKKRAPRDKWQELEIIIFPDRHFTMSARNRISGQPPFCRINMARPDYISDMVRAFYELDVVSTKEHPIRFRKATVADYPFIAAMCQMTFGPHEIYHVKNIAKLLNYCVVADDPMYGIVSVAAIGESEVESSYEVKILITAENYRGLSMATRCLTKAANALLEEHPNAKVTAAVPMADKKSKDVAHSALRRAGFKKFKIVRGEKRYRCFDCDRCNMLNGYCDPFQPDSVCSTVYYQMTDMRRRQIKKG